MKPQALKLGFPATHTATQATPDMEIDVGFPIVWAF